MQQYHAYEIQTSDSAMLIWVDLDPKELLRHFAVDLETITNDADIERITLGMVHGENVEDAIGEVRAGNWQTTASNSYFGEYTPIQRSED